MVKYLVPISTPSPLYCPHHTCVQQSDHNSSATCILFDLPCIEL